MKYADVKNTEGDGTAHRCPFRLCHFEAETQDELSVHLQYMRVEVDDENHRGLLPGEEQKKRVRPAPVVKARREPEATDEDKIAAYDELVEFARVCAGDGYISTRATARDLLMRLGISRMRR